MTRRNSLSKDGVQRVTGRKNTQNPKPQYIRISPSLNKETEMDGYYLPNKERIIASIRDKRYFSKFDCKSGFWQIRLIEESIPLTAFSCPSGHYEWLVMPFGLKQAPQIFQRRMDNILKTYSDYLFSLC
jgi:hypothetical protein